MLNEYTEKYGENRYDHTQGNFSILPFYKNNFRHIGSESISISDLPEALKSMLKHTLALRRVDYFSKYLEHNNSPSARNLHSTSLILVWSKKVYCFDIFKNELVYMYESKSVFFEYKKIYYIGLCDVYNLSRYYGDFSIYLSLLDSGHLLFNILNTMFSQDVLVTYHDNVPEIEGQSIRGFFSEKCFISYCIEMENSLPNVVSHRGENSCIQIQSKSQYASPLCTLMLKCLNMARQEKRDLKGWKPISQPDLLIRNSAHNRVGNCRLTDHKRSLPIVEWDQELSGLLGCINNSKVKYVWVARNGVESGIERNTIKTLSSLSGFLNNDHEFFCMDEFDLALIIYCEKIYFKAEKLKSLLTLSALLMQAACVMAANRGLPFRPMKNHSDITIVKKLNLDPETEILYMGVLCEENSFQLDWQIGGW